MISIGLKSFIFSSDLCALRLGKRREARFFKLLKAKKRSTGEKIISSSSLGFSKSLVARAALAIFSLGFVDAGFSGDWSRVGVISKENEELLKLATYVIVPLCIFIAFSISDETDTSN